LDRPREPRAVKNAQLNFVYHSKIKNANNDKQIYKKVAFFLNTTELSIRFL